MQTNKTKMPAEAASRHAELPSRSHNSTTRNLPSTLDKMSSEALMAFVRQLFAHSPEFDEHQQENPSLTPAAKARYVALNGNLSTVTKLGLTTKETAEALSCSVKTLARLRARGLLLPVVATRTLIYPVASIVKFLRDNTASPAADSNTAH